MKQKPALFLALAVFAGACTKQADTAKPDDGKAACTEEAKLCPDGSSVSRTGPDCEFPACPGEDQADEKNADGGEADDPAEGAPPTAEGADPAKDGE